LATEAYRFSRRLPSAERFGLRSQIERAAVSVAANIAEGLGRGSDGDLERFLRIAAGSAAEVEILARLSARLYQLDDGLGVKLAQEVAAVRRMLNRFVQRVHNTRFEPPASG
jgi:four helix bundle protein